jgi:hypothetical protein
VVQNETLVAQIEEIRLDVKLMGKSTGFEPDEKKKS